MTKGGWFDETLFQPDSSVQLKQAPFTLKEIKESIPKHLFKDSLSKSWYYIGRDLTQWAVVAFATYHVLQQVENTYMRALIWCMYWFLQGTTGFGLWVIGHECGHQGYFGNRKGLNNAVGLVIHTFLLAPYDAWRITHATHHKYTNNREKDTAFPELDHQAAFWGAMHSFQPIIILNMLMYLLIGWPCYLFLNFEGAPFDTFTNHFDLNSPYFQPSDRADLIRSNSAWVGMVGLLGYLSYIFGFNTVFCWYGGCIVVNYAWLVCITLLQHADQRIPHYDDADFDFVRGALCTVDRDYGVFNNWMHHITNGHLVHHLFSNMPFYNAIEATPFVAKKLGEFYTHDERPLFTQMWCAFHAHQASFQKNPRYLKTLKKQ